MIDKNIWCTNVQNYYVFKDQDIAENKSVEIKTFNINSILNSGNIAHPGHSANNKPMIFNTL